MTERSSITRIYFEYITSRGEGEKFFVYLTSRKKIQLTTKQKLYKIRFKNCSLNFSFKKEFFLTKNLLF